MSLCNANSYTQGVWRLAWILLLPALVCAQSSGGSYVMRKQVIASGVKAQGGTYVLTGTAQQPIAFVQAAGSYKLTGGFHGAVGAVNDVLFCDGFEGTPCD